jgi:hypothetical protein
VTPEQFVQKWNRSTLKESAGAKEHFIDLCRLLELPTPAEADPTGDSYTFERNVRKASGRKGFADVWKRGAFAWEYKGKHKDLDLAYQQLLAYRDDLENPPLSVVSDMNVIVLHTNFVNHSSTETFTLEDLLDGAKRERLKAIWMNWNLFNPASASEQVTAAVVRDLEAIADSLGARGHDRDEIAHFLVRCVFTLFAEDVGLLPENAFSRILTEAIKRPRDFKPMAQQLFTLMKSGGPSLVGRIAHFNGGVFDSDAAPDLELRDLQRLEQAARKDWKAINPSIFGTLFERIIDPGKRRQLGAHYTTADDILAVIEPVILEPLRSEWNTVLERVSGLAQNTVQDGVQAASLFQETPLWDKAKADALRELEAFQTRLSGVRVLDPACGSGNFLYLTLRALLDLESQVRAWMRVLEPGRPAPSSVLPSQMLGLEKSPYAHEIAGMVLWVGYLQWMRERGEAITREPILERLTNLQNRDAVLDGDKPAPWPDAEFIVGNPPFLGDKKMRRELGDDYVNALRKAFDDRVPGQADFVCYWFEQARANIEHNKSKRAGLIATNSIRGGANRKVLERIKDTGDIFMAWPDREWIQDGANVRVSIVGFDDGSDSKRTILTPSSSYRHQFKILFQNLFQPSKKSLHQPRRVTHHPQRIPPQPTQLCHRQHHQIRQPMPFDPRPQQLNRVQLWRVRRQKHDLEPFIFLQEVHNLNVPMQPRIIQHHHDFSSNSSQHAFQKCFEAQPVH